MATQATSPRAIDARIDAAVIDRYEAGGSALATAIAGLGRKELLAPPPAGARGTWTIQQIVMHLMDSDLIASDRMKRIIAEDDPILIGYDETRFAQYLPYDKLDAAAASEIFRLNRVLTAAVLRTLPPAAFARTGQPQRARRTHAGVNGARVYPPPRSPPGLPARKAPAAGPLERI